MADGLARDQLPEPSTWHLSRLVIEREGYQDARQRLSEARSGYLAALSAARAAGWSLRALSAATGISLRQVCRDAKKAGGGNVEALVGNE